MRRIGKNLKHVLFAAAVCTAGLGCGLLVNAETRNFANAEESEINVAEIGWVSGTDTQLQSSAGVYCYSYTSFSGSGTYYSASELKLPLQDGWENWERVSFTEYRDSVIYRADDNYRTSYSVKLSPADSLQYTIGEYKNATAKAAGQRYTTSVTLTANDGYQFITGTAGNTYSDSARGLRVTVSDNGATATVEKSWYLLDWGNALLSRPSEGSSSTEPIPYSLASWQFGDREHVPVYPWLQHGDEAYLSNGVANPYELKYDNETIVNWSIGTPPSILQNWNLNNGGEQDLVTFSLSRKNESGDQGDKDDDSDYICTDAPRSQWGYYINEFTPVGEYEITFSVKSFSLSQHNDWMNSVISYGEAAQPYLYRGFTVSYDFEVTPASFGISDGGWKGASKEIDLANVSGGSDLFGVIGEVAYTNYPTVSAERAGYWAEAENYEEYFDESPTLKFNLSGAFDNDYYAANDEFWNGKFISPEKFRVFYQAEAKNYLPLHAAAEKYEYYFDVVLYRTLTVPTLAETEFVYNGSLITALFAGSVPADEGVFYTVTGNTAYEANYDGETYSVTVSLNDKTGLYRWAAGDSTRDITLDYRVSKAKEGWAEPVGVVEWQYNHYAPAANRFTGVPDSGLSVTFTVAQEVEGEKVAVGNLGNIVCEKGVVTDQNQINTLSALDAGIYYLKAVVDASKNYTGAESEWISFEISPDGNRWAVTPNFVAWEYGGYDASVHKRYGEAEHGNTDFRFYRLVGGDRSGAGIPDITGFAPDKSYNGVPAGTYEMVVTANGGNNYDDLEESVVFEIRRAKNGWLVAPNVTSWLRGDAAGEIVGTPKFGTPVFTAVDLDGKTVYDSTKDALSTFEGLGAGSYRLIASVAADGDYEGISNTTVKFNVIAQRANGWRVTPNIQGWTEGETPDQPVGAPLFGEIVFGYETENGASLGSEAPTEAGNYVLIASVAAYTDGVTGEQYEGLRAAVKFTISPKPILINGWLTVPSIQNWQEGETPSEPAGEAKVGSAPLFTYTTADGVALNARPTQAGSYYLIATVNANGYETLTARVPFTVSPAPAKTTNRVQDLNGNILDFVAVGVPEGSALGVNVLTNLGDSAAFWQYNTQAIAGVGCSVGAMYDLSLQDASGQTIQPNGSVTVTLTIPNELRGKAGLQVAHVGELGEVELLGGSVQGDKITFTTEHFSTFCLVWADAQGKAGNSAGAIFLTVLIEVLVLAVLVTGGYVWYLAWKRTKGKRIVAEIAVTVPAEQNRPVYNEMLEGQTVVPIQPENPFSDDEAPKDKN